MSPEKESSEKQKKSKHKINEKRGIGTTVGKVAAEQPKYGQIPVISRCTQHDQQLTLLRELKRLENREVIQLLGK